MRVAAHGMITDTGGSSAGAFTGLLRTLLERGHEVEFFGVKGFTEPKSLEVYPGYRFHRISLAWNRRVRPWVLKLGNRYLESTLSTLTYVDVQRAAIAAIEASEKSHDFVLCLDAPNIWKSRLPVLSWPQAPPQTEWAALRRPHIARAMLRGNGALYYGAVQAFYAWRWALGKAALRTSDVILCGSPWAHDRWLEFGLDPARAVLLAYPIDLASFESVPPARASSDHVSFLWLGRSVPRKRMDLFLGAFELVRKRRPNARARLVGHFDGDRAALAALERFRADPAVTISAPIGRAAIPGLFAETHVLVQPSEFENFGFSIAEALAAGRAVVAGPTNGTAAFGGDALFAFSSYTVEDVAAAMDRAAAAILADPERIARMARAAAHRHFAPGTVAERVTSLAQGLIEKRRSGPERPAR
jgi:glycosyltransferase involved in cell wall biosynthesis